METQISPPLLELGQGDVGSESEPVPDACERQHDLTKAAPGDGSGGAGLSSLLLHLQLGMHGSTTSTSSYWPWRPD